MQVSTVEKTNYRRMPWVNGGGETTELFVHEEADSSRYHWRISMADVASSGPFSLFVGYQRILVLLEGAGLSLFYEDGSESELQQRYGFAEFSGDIKTCATVKDGPIRDFNVIVARSRFRPVLSIVNAGECFQALPNTKFVIIYASDCDVVIDAPNNGSNLLSRGNLLVIEDPENGEWRVSDGTGIVTQMLKPQPKAAVRNPTARRSNG